MSLTVGTHSCRVLPPASGWFGEQGENNSEFFRLPLVILDGLSKGEKLIWQGWLNKQTNMERTEKALKEAFPEWDGNWTKLAAEVSTGHFIGRRCDIVTEEEEYPRDSGKFSIKVKWLNPPGGGRGKILDASRARILAHRLQQRSEPATPPPRPAADPDLDAPDDDLPF